MPTPCSSAATFSPASCRLTARLSTGCTRTQPLPRAYAEFADMPEGRARRLRDEFFTKDMLSPDKILVRDRQGCREVEIHSGLDVDETAHRNCSSPSPAQVVWRMAAHFLAAVTMTTCDRVAISNWVDGNDVDPSSALNSALVAAPFSKTLI